MMLKNFNKLWDYYKDFYNFKAKNMIFKTKEEKEQEEIKNNGLWFA